MADKDLYNEITVTSAFIPQALSGTADITGTVIDTKGYGSLTFILTTDAIAAADLDAQLLIKEDDTSFTGTNVADADLIGTEALTQVGVGAAGDRCKRIGYKGNKRYVRADFVVTANDATDVVGCVAILGHPLEGPTAADAAG